MEGVTTEEDDQEPRINPDVKGSSYWKRNTYGSPIMTTMLGKLLRYCFSNTTRWNIAGNENGDSLLSPKAPGKC